jgi:hypothetical protein
MGHITTTQLLLEEFQMAQITVSHRKFTKHENRLIAEISELGWPWFPQFVEVQGRNECRLFGPPVPIMNGEEIAGFKYPQTDTTLKPVFEVHVLND